MGLPVLASAVGGNVEVLSKGGGVLLPAGDPKALSEAIVQISEDIEGRRRLGAEARQVVVNYYSEANMLRVLDSVYSTILSEAKP